MAAVRFLPKEEVPNFVEELDEAFIRFVYFSPANERKTKLFADRLGLDTVLYSHCSFLSSLSSLSGASLSFILMISDILF
jgi:predicted HAD superfamily phosphohydrolase YqeG